MFTLIIDTSTEKSLVTFALGQKVLLELRLSIGLQSSKTLMPEIESGFQQLKLSPFDLERVGVGVGPGSYTGTRVGVAAAQGLAFPRRLPLISFCSLEAFTYQGEGIFISLIDAKSSGYYALMQKREGSQIITKEAPFLLARADLEKNAQLPQAGPHISYPDSNHLASLVNLKYKTGSFSSFPHLIYLR